MMIDPVVEYERFLRSTSLLACVQQARRSRMQPLIWFERGFNRMLKAFWR